MKEYKLLENKPASEMEEEILSSWGSVNDILNKTIENRNSAPYWVFYDGPATANGFPVIRYTKLIFLNFLLNQGITGYSSLIQSI